jgi:hypothetical protein
MHNTAGECEVTNHARAITSLSGLVSPAPLCFQLPTFITTTYNIQIALFSVSIFPTQASGRWRKLEHEAKSVPGSQVPYTPHRLSINTLVREALADAWGQGYLQLRNPCLASDGNLVTTTTCPSSHCLGNPVGTKDDDPGYARHPHLYYPSSQPSTRVLNHLVFPMC